MLVLLLLAAWLLIMLGVLVWFWVDDRAVERREAVERRKEQVLADALHTKALLDQEAFRAARAMHDAAVRARR